MTAVSNKMKDLNQYISEKLKTLRQSYAGGKGISQSELGKLMGENANTISRWETGEYKPTTLDLWNLSQFFQVPISVFFNHREDSNELRVMKHKILTKQDREEILNFIKFKIWMRSPDRKKSGRPRNNERHN
ncbi:helix-turn-helix domain-containing protein [Leptospira stimsonii]|uniref:XRE family transcriptional regulator n=1 Tax=Leptospira stimsonii TaxID=2202203 RepID=A0A396Z380_9LEPT|nr:helix-turn-helix transcriptional regulator [Leptospira stimsonii]RHX89889.1 XRE family transcriptional regulator [Leptospira stimsonii]